MTSSNLRRTATWAGPTSACRMVARGTTAVDPSAVTSAAGVTTGPEVGDGSRGTGRDTHLSEESPWLARGGEWLRLRRFGPLISLIVATLPASARHPVPPQTAYPEPPQVLFKDLF